MTKFLKSLLFVLVVVGLSSSYLKADSINVTAGVGSKHFLPFDLNEKNGGIGIGYEHNFNEDVAINLDYLSFINSYNKDTNFIGLTGSYTPFNYNDYKFGVFGGIVHNDGYCKFYNVCQKGEDTTDFLPIGGLMVQLDNLIIKGMALPNTKTNKIDAVVWMIQLKAMEF